jgi:hypothetical protein
VSRPQVAGRKPLRPSKPFPGLAVDAPLVRLRLVADDRGGVIERRRHDCTRLATCELEWIRAHGGAQARCPVGCIRYEREAPRELAMLSGGGIVVMS